MPLYYALPLAFGLTGAIAITLVLIEVVPRVLEERERRKSREGRAVARKRREEPVKARGSARDENGWGYEIRQRKGKGNKDERDEGQENPSLLRPIKTEREEDRARYVLSNPSDIELSSPDIERRPIKSSTFEPLHPVDETTTTTTTPPEDTSATKSSPTQSNSDPSNPSSPSLVPAPPISKQPWCPTALNLIDISQSPLPASQASTDPNPLESSTTHSSSLSSPVLLPTSEFASPSLSHSTEPEWTFDSSPSSPEKKEKKLESESESDAGWFRLSDDDDEDDEGGGDAEEIGGREVEEGAMREWEKVGREKGRRALM